MSPPSKTYMSWSTGKDAAMALYYLLQDRAYDIDLLITTVNAHHDRVSMHGLRRSLLERQVEAIGMDHECIELPEQPGMEEYATLMDAKLRSLRERNYTSAGFGDIFLEDLKTYRDAQLAKHEIRGVYPLWKKSSKSLIADFIKLGFKAIVVCISAEVLDASFVGREVDESFIADLPPDVDPCGENGEFHTFCYDGPVFKHPVDFTLGRRVLRKYPDPSASDNSENAVVHFQFVDLL